MGEDSHSGEDREKWGGVLFVPEHLPKSIGDWQLAEAGEERTVWRRFRTAPAGKFKHEVQVFQQYSGWTVKHRYNVGVDNDMPGGYRYIEPAGQRAIFDEREQAEQRAIELLEEKVQE